MSNSRTVIILHNVIEVIRPEDSGYSVNRVTLRGAHAAVRLLRSCDIVVVSAEVAKHLATGYGITPVLTEESPCEWTGYGHIGSEGGPLRVVVLGYLAPYKGLSSVLEVAKILSGKIKIQVVGRAHRILEKSSYFRAALESFEVQARAEGIELKGYVLSQDLPQVLAENDVALLAYSSTSGSSASFATLASAGLPVVATRLPEFERLKQMGAGVVLADSNPSGIAAELVHLSQDKALRDQLAVAQEKFARAHSWSRFTGRVLAVLNT